MPEQNRVEIISERKKILFSDLAAQLAGIREQKGLTVNELVGLSGVSGTDIERMERGDFALPVASLLRVIVPMGFALAAEAITVPGLRDETPVDIEVEVPTWLDKEAQRLNLDLSLILAEALKKKLGIAE